MNLEELKSKIYKYNVPSRWYSLDEGLKPNACILYKNHSKWEYFFLDERGERNDYKIFQNDEDAYDYLWKMLQSNLRVFKIQPRSDIE